MKKIQKNDHLQTPLRRYCLCLALAIGMAIASPPVLLAEQQAPPAKELLRYRQQTGKAAHIYSWKLEQQGENVLITLEEPDATFTNLCAPDGATLAWTMVAPPNTNVRAERRKDTLHVQGTFKGEAVDKELQLGKRVWFQSLSFALSRMVAMDRAERKFWFLRSDELELLGMRAELAGSEQIVADGKTVAAERVRIKLDKLVAAFWEASYWFRKSDQLFLRYRGVNGPPGTDETVIDLQPK